MPPKHDVRQFVFGSHPRWLQGFSRGPAPALLLCALVLTGCATKSPKPPPTPQTAAAQPQPAQPKAKQPFLAGAFSWLKYVPTFSSAGDLLVCIRDKKETANLRMGNLKNPPFLIADIASGNPAPGDRVFKP
jgi:hypothetical protein